jgi:hypothetical protein
MPTISMFYGILVSMFFEDTDRHHLEIHQDKLMADWELAKAGEHPYPIDPLR